MTEEDIEAFRARTRAMADAHADATVYKMNNPYLRPMQKGQVEAIYQFPLAAMGYAFGLLAVFGDQSIYLAYGYASAVGALAWLVARFKGNSVVWLGLAFGGWIETGINLALAGYAIYLNKWGLAVILGLNAFGITSVVMLPMWFWKFSGGAMHAKYAIAKRKWGMTFPFESHQAL